MRKSLYALTLVAFLFSTTSAYAEYTLSMYEVVGNEDAFKSYLTGVGRGIQYANEFMKAQGVPPLFCMPNNLSLDESIIHSLLDQEIRRPSGDRKYNADNTIEMILTISFIRRFPCK